MHAKEEVVLLRKKNNDFEYHLNEKMKDLEFKASWDALEADYSLFNTLVKIRNSADLTQQQLSEKSALILLS